MTEAERQARIMLAVGALPGVRLFRNTVGEGWVGQQVRSPTDLVVLKNASRITFGLHPGSHDTIGWRSVVVTKEMLGRTVAVFIGGEVKTDAGRLAEPQKRFHAVLNSYGGISGVWRTPEDALADLSPGGSKRLA